MTGSDSTTKVCTKCGNEKPATTEYFHAMRGRLRTVCKDCRRLYYAANREHILEQKRLARLGKERERILARDRAWKKAHPENVASSKSLYNAANRAKNCEAAKAYNIAHKAEIKERRRLWRLSHPEIASARDVAYRLAHPEARAAVQRNRRARERSAEGSHTAADVQAQYERQKGKCFYCGGKLGGGYHVDHVIPLISGGSNGPENLVVSCPACNLSKGPKHPQEFCGRLL